MSYNPFDKIIDKIVPPQENTSLSNDNQSNSENVKQDTTSVTNVVEYKVEDEFDKNLIPTTKIIGILSSILVGITSFYQLGINLYGVLITVVGIMGTLGLCILLEGFSTIIKLLRKISEK